MKSTDSRFVAIGIWDRILNVSVMKCSNVHTVGLQASPNRPCNQSFSASNSQIAASFWADFKPFNQLQKAYSYIST